LLVPAGLCFLTGLGAPAVGTLIASFSNPRGMDLVGAEFVGLDNYAAVLADPSFVPALRFTWALFSVRMLAVLAAPLVPALVAARFGRRLRLWMRLLLTAPLAAFAPAAGVVAWVMTLSPGIGLVKVDFEHARALYLILDGLATFGLACGLAMTLIPAALRGMGDAGARPWWEVWRPLPTFWLLGGLAVLALTLQSMVGSFFLGGRADSGLMTLGLYHYGTMFEPGPGLNAAVATLMLVVLVLLGSVAGRILVKQRLRLFVAPREESGAEAGGGVQAGRGRTALIVAALLAGLMVCALVVLPWLWVGLTSIKSEADFSAGARLPTSPSREAYTLYVSGLPAGRALLITYVLPLAGILLVVVPVAYAAAFSIALLRPLGERSDRLLYPFSPWLFVTIGPLMLASFKLWARLMLVNSTFALLLPPIALSVPALFVLWAFFRGREPAWRAGLEAGRPVREVFYRNVFLPSLPLALLLAGAILLVNAAEMAWPQLVLYSQKPTATVMLSAQLTSVAASGMPPSAVAALLVVLFVPAALLFFVAFGVAQVRYLDRLVLAFDVEADARGAGERASG
jgi:ABC-type sugar transport system permease subunit